MKLRILVFAFLVSLELAFAAEEGSVKKDVQGAGQAIKREWKKGWRATKKAAKTITRGAADATEKTAKKVKQNIDD